ncbi:MAG: hypothetical protein QOI21_3857 [Actinomycetota bacterium]|nr:hypothetical protein [Actinomycetota bacterium]
MAEVKEPCSLLSGDAVGKAISREGVTGRPGAERTDPAGSGVSKTCVFSAAGSDVGWLAATHFEGSKVTPAQMIAAIKNSKAGAVEVPGIGESAVYFSVPGESATLAAGKVVRGVPTLINYTDLAKMTQEMMTPLVKQAIESQ